MSEPTGTGGLPRGQRPRAGNARGKILVPTIAGRVRLRPEADLHAEPEESGRQAARLVAAQAAGWWLHSDLDVLDRTDFTACGAPGEVSSPGGLTWPELTALTESARWT